MVLYRAAAGDQQAQAAQSLPYFGAGITVEDVYDLTGEAQTVAASTAAAAPAAAEDALQIARVSASMDTAALLASLSELPYVVAAEPNYRYTLNANFNDPYYATGLQWPLSESAGIHADALWTSSAAAGGPAMVVAVIDTGVDYGNPDLQGRLLDPLHAFDAYPQSGLPTGQETASGGHGTHVAGIIAAATDNARGMAGVMGAYPNVSIMPVKVFNNGGAAYLGDVVAGIEHVINANFNIVAANMSFGNENNHSSPITSFALTMLGEAGILPVRSAGNKCRDIEKYGTYPTIYENPYTVAVGGTGRDSAFATTYSNFNDAIVHMAAPGTAILSTYLKGHGGFVDSSGAPRVFDAFEDTTRDYTLTLAAVDGQSHVIPSSARTFVERPKPDGYYRRGHSLQFTFTPSDGHYDYRLELPDDLAILNDGETLGLRIRAQASVDTPQGILSIGTPPVVKNPLDNDSWAYLSLAASSDGKAHLWFSYYDTAPATISLDDLGIKYTNDVAYAYADGTSMAAPHVSGAYALLCAVDPGMPLDERRARLIGSARTSASFAGKVNAGGTLDLSNTLSADTSTFAPVMDKIEQNGRTVTVTGWFFGNAPRATLDGRALTFTRTGDDGKCTLTFTLPAGMSGVKTLALTKPGNGRSCRMRYRYNAAGNMKEICDAPQTPLVYQLLNDGDTLYCLCSTLDGFSLYRLDGDALVPVSDVPSAGDRASRDDFTACIDGGVLYVYDFDHVHRCNLATGTWLSDLPGPGTLDQRDTGFRTGAIASYGGRLMILGGSYFDSSAGMRERHHRDHVCVYDPGTGLWQNAEPFPNNLSLSAAQAVTCGSDLFLFATTPRGDGKMLRFDGASWTETTIPHDLSACTFGVQNGKILCFGDADAAQGILRYDPASGAWDRLPYWGTGLPHTARGAVADGRIYALTALQDFSRYILQTVPLPQPGPGGGGGSGSAHGDVYVPIPTPTPVPVPAPPATGAAAPSPLLYMAGLALLLCGAYRLKKRL